jgi:hypothetical protein
VNECCIQMKKPRDVPGIAGRVSTIPAGKAEEALLMLIQGRTGEDQVDHLPVEKIFMKLIRVFHSISQTIS